jgi:integrase
VTAAIVEGPFPNRGLKYPKTREKPRFQTWQEIKTQIEEGDLTEDKQRDLWDCLFLSTEDIEELLKHVKSNARHPFIYPMFVTAAHTGARRSELLRSQLADFDRGFVNIRERKRVRGQLSTRRVPLSRELAHVLADWRSVHPGGSSSFCIQDRGRFVPISRDEANDHFQRTLAGSKWSVIRGWHCLRHSFCSNCALKAIDQRIIDSWVGHSTESMRRRYRHLFPNQESAALKLVFC